METCNFTSLSPAFQSNENDGMVIMHGCIAKRSSCIIQAVDVLVDGFEIQLYSTYFYVHLYMGLVLICNQVQR